MAEVLVGAGEARQRAVADVLVELAPMHPDLARMPACGWVSSGFLQGPTILVPGGGGGGGGGGVVEAAAVAAAAGAGRSSKSSDI